MTIEEQTFVEECAKQAESAGHIWPRFATCEAALESNYGKSALARCDHNLFGMKAHRHMDYGVHILPTREWANSEWITINSSFVSYPSIKECFADRMATLLRLASAYPHYAAALAAVTGETFVSEVSKSWSTDPQRGEKVLAIYRQLAVPPQGMAAPPSSAIVEVPHAGESLLEN